jgi:hypothetical protein
MNTLHLSFSSATCDCNVFSEQRFVHLDDIDILDICLGLLHTLDNNGLLLSLVGVLAVVVAACSVGMRAQPRPFLNPQPRPSLGLVHVLQRPKTTTYAHNDKKKFTTTRKSIFGENVWFVSSPTTRNSHMPYTAPGAFVSLA